MYGKPHAEGDDRVEAEGGEQQGQQGGSPEQAGPIVHARIRCAKTAGRLRTRLAGKSGNSSASANRTGGTLLSGFSRVRSTKVRPQPKRSLALGATRGSTTSCGPDRIRRRPATD